MCRYLGLDIDSIRMEIRLPKDKFVGEKYNFQKRAGEFGGSFGSLLPCGGWR